MLKGLVTFLLLAEGKYCAVIISQHVLHRSDSPGGSNKGVLGTISHRAHHISAEPGRFDDKDLMVKGHPEPQILATVIKYPLDH